MGSDRLEYYDFFAGGGMARLGLGSNWQCLMSNDWCPKKARAYKLSFGSSPELIVSDVCKLTIEQLPGSPMLAWASFPCQDLSLAGNGRGLNGKRSGTFWPFWQLMADMNYHGRPLPMIVLENVAGAITSHKGKDFQAILEALCLTGYRAGAMVIDAVYFVPQSRPRLFIVAVKKDIPVDRNLFRQLPGDYWHPKLIREAYAKLPKRLKDVWVWWNLPIPDSLLQTLSSLVEDDPSDIRWHTPEETQRLLGQMSEINLRKVMQAQNSGEKIVGTVYKRTRQDEHGGKVQRAEVRFDQISGCLRTPAGGSSRQLIIFVQGATIKSRLLSAREAARLMGVSDDYTLPENYNEAYHLMGDGLVVPVVSWIEKHLLFPLAISHRSFQEN